MVRARTLQELRFNELESVLSVHNLLNHRWKNNKRPNLSKKKFKNNINVHQVHPISRLIKIENSTSTHSRNRT